MVNPVGTKLREVRKPSLPDCAEAAGLATVARASIRCIAKIREIVKRTHLCCDIVKQIIVCCGQAIA
jgi:hypothetical protein